MENQQRQSLMSNHEWRVIKVALGVCLGGFLFGFDASVISGVIGFVSGKFDLSDAEIGLLVGAPTIGGLLGGLLSGVIADAIGRKRVLVALACIYLLSACLSALAPSFDTLVAARALGGLAFASLSIAPMYIAEISPEQRRGFFVSFNQFAIVIGFSAAYFANYALVTASQSGAEWVTLISLDTQTWRWMLGVEILPAVVWLIILMRITETPRWLVLNGKGNEGKEILTWLQGEQNAHETLKEIELSNRHQAPLLKRLGWLASPALRVPFFIAISVGIIQQVTGINAVFFYAPTIFEQSGVGTNAAFAQATWVGVTNVVFTVIAMLTIDRLGRRPLLLIGLTGIIISMSLVSYGFHQASYKIDETVITELNITDDTATQLQPLVGKTFTHDVAFKNALQDALGVTEARNKQSTIIAAAISVNAWLVLAGILGFVASFAMSLGPVMWVLFSEVFPNHIRGLAVGVATIFNSAASFGVQFFFPIQLSTIGSSFTFLIYAFLGVIGIFVCWRLPETKGASLEALEKQLA